MKRRDLEKVVAKRLAHIEKYSKQIPGHFATEDIHELRVEFKKLRAFTRLLQLEKGGGHLQVPQKLKSLYHAAGETRDIQLFLQQLQKVSEKHPLPTFIKHWQHELFRCKEDLVKEIEKSDFEKVESNIRHHLPDTLQESTIEKFVHRKVAAIHIILIAAEQDKDLHSIRKNLKDLSYEIKIFKADLGIAFPVKAWKSEKQMNEMTTRLGDFNDQCILLSFFQEDFSQKVPVEEHSVIENWKRSIIQQKEKVKDYLLQQVQKLQLVHDFQLTA
jgi:CHAD domain-containing protein